MWFLKFLLLLSITASWIPREKIHDFYSSPNLSMDYESEEEDEEDSEELAA